MQLEEELAEGRLIALFPQQPLTTNDHFLCPPRRLNLSGVIAFRDWLRAEIDAA